MRHLPIAGLALLLAACSHETPAAEQEASRSPDVSFSSEIPGEPVSVLTSTSGEVQLGLTDEVFTIGLTDQLADRVQKDLEDAEAEGGLGGFIAGAVSGAVVGAMSTPVQIPLDDVETIRYENGQLDVVIVDEDSDVDLTIEDEPGEMQFDPDEARRFVAAFHELTGR